jgi:hypothetical protein
MTNSFSCLLVRVKIVRMSDGFIDFLLSTDERNEKKIKMYRAARRKLVFHP